MMWRLRPNGACRGPRMLNCCGLHADGPVFVTGDRDLGLVFMHALDAGVFYLRMLPSTIRATHEELERVLDLYCEDELRGSFVVIEPGRHRMRRASGSGSGTDASDAQFPLQNLKLGLVSQDRLRLHPPAPDFWPKLLPGHGARGMIPSNEVPRWWCACCCPETQGRRGRGEKPCNAAPGGNMIGDFTAQTAGVAQPVEHRFCKPRVVSSSLTASSAGLLD